MVFENIPVKKETKDLVDAECKNKESYDEIIKRILADRSRCTCVTSQESSVQVGARLVEENRRKEGWGK